ncbi:Nodule Cysteine-Rich (NCR) secreted peptide [Medicago truncatula]|uniref:Nodule Cysteine-Rich (NCR) secreted peptide n=1 Tax=Medicago truncatula TaxID=3880 RepID=A0A072TZU7_MEDTR|nr:Nodule Cysteine-Rich (NCR) secreted peptide [Medicago truncatula]
MVSITHNHSICWCTKTNNYKQEAKEKASHDDCAGAEIFFDGESKLEQTCSEDFECYIKNPHVPFGHLRCFEGFCQQLNGPA